MLYILRCMYTVCSCVKLRLSADINKRKWWWYIQLTVRDYRAVYSIVYRPAKPLNRSRCRLRCGLWWDQGSMCYMGVHIGTTWLMRLNRPCSGGPNEEAAMRPYVKLLWPLVIIIIIIIIIMNNNNVVVFVVVVVVNRQRRPPHVTSFPRYHEQILERSQ